MSEDLKQNLQRSLYNIDTKSNKIYFFVQDTKGNAKASIRFIYDIANSLTKEGYKVVMLYEKSDYTPIDSWSFRKYEGLEFQVIEGTNLQIAPEDILVIPEIFGFVMEQVKNLPCGKIVLCQAYDHVLETLKPGQTWPSLGFFKCITTSQQQKEYIEGIMRGVSLDVLKPVISDSFQKSTIPSKPIIAIHSRDQRDSINVIKTFYLKFPQYRWITFRDMRGLSQSEFAKSLKECFLSVWIDETSSYGTFPLESMKSNVPVLGLVPNLIPEWMNENNGIWLNNKNQITDFIADFIQNWLEDNIKPELYTNMETTAKKYMNKQKFETEVTELFSSYLNTRADSFEEQLSKITN